MSTDTIRTLSFDPGLSTAGWAIGDYTLKTGHLVINRFGELSPNRYSERSDVAADVEKYGKRIITLATLREMVNALYTEYHPDYVAVEDAFYNPTRPTAYAALLQWITTVELYLYFNFQVPLFKIAPKSIKQCISGYGASGKLNVQQSVLSNKNISFKQKRQLGELREHEGDAIAVNYTFNVEILPGLLAQ